MASPDGVPHSPRKLLSILISTLVTTSYHYYSNRYKLDANAPPLLIDDSRPFPETARWCLCAFKNLTRPGKLSSSSLADDVSGNAAAAFALLDAGVMPLLLRIVRVAEVNAASTETIHRQDPLEVGVETATTSKDVVQNFPSWYSNSAQDAALYTLLHMSSVPGVRRTLREDCGCVAELLNIVNCGTTNEKLLIAVTDCAPGVGPDETDLAQLGLQCMKAVSKVFPSADTMILCFGCILNALFTLAANCIELSCRVRRSLWAAARYGSIGERRKSDVDGKGSSDPSYRV